MSTASLPELLAASGLLTTLERICASGVLTMEEEIRARFAIGRAYEAFGIDSVAERESAEVIQLPARL